MNNPNEKINFGDYHTDLQCTPITLNCNETIVARCAKFCQTEIALVPSSPVTDLYNKITYIDQEKIDEDALRIIDLPQKAKRRSLLPVSKFGLTDLLRPQNDNLTEKYLKETVAWKDKTEEMSCQTDLEISPHILNKEEMVAMPRQTPISGAASISTLKILPEPKKYFDYDDDEREQLYKNAAEIITEIVHDVIAIPQRNFAPAIITPVVVELSRTSCSTDNSEWNMLIPEENATHSQIRDDDSGMFDFIVDNSCKGDILYCRSDDNVSVDSTVSEISSILSLEYTTNSNVDDFPVYAEILENDAFDDIESNQSSMRLMTMEVEEILKME